MKLFHHLTVIHGFIANISDFLVLSGAICSVMVREHCQDRLRTALATMTKQRRARWNLEVRHKENIVKCVSSAWMPQ